MKQFSSGIGIALALALISSVVAFPTPAEATDQYVWCWSAPLRPDNRKMFYSGIFTAIPSQQRDMQSKFGQYVQTNYPDDNTGNGECKFYSTRDYAQSDLSKDKKNSDFNHQQIIDTGWTYTP
jgi:hypothetical protein